MKHIPKTEYEVEIVEMLKAYTDEEIETMVIPIIDGLNVMTSIGGIMAMTIAITMFFEPVTSWFTVGILILLGMLGAGFSINLEKTKHVAVALIGKR